MFRYSKSIRIHSLVKTKDVFDKMFIIARMNIYGLVAIKNLYDDNLLSGFVKKKTFLFREKNGRETHISAKLF